MLMNSFCYRDLVRLDVGSARLTDGGNGGLEFDLSGFNALAEAVKTNTKLRTLMLSDNTITGRAGGEILSSILEHNTVLTMLDVSRNGQTPSDDGTDFAQALSVGLKANISLEHLKITHSALGKPQVGEPSGIQVMSEALSIHVSAQ